MHIGLAFFNGFSSDPDQDSEQLSLNKSDVNEYVLLSKAMSNSDTKYLEYLKTFYGLLFQINPDNFKEEPIENKIINIGLENFKNILPLENLEIINVSLYILLNVEKTEGDSTKFVFPDNIKDTMAKVKGGVKK